MAGHNSFRDPITNILTAHGFVESNSPTDVKQSETDDFALQPGKWQWNGASWVPFTPPPPPPSPLAVALDALLAIPNPNITQIIAAIRVWRQQVS